VPSARRSLTPVPLGALRRMAVATLAVLAAWAPPASAQQPSQQRYDVLIRGARVLDGSGNPWFFSDVGISGERIAAVGNLAGASAARVIDASGLYLAPGFIDVHSHAGPGLATAELSAAVPLLAQGITTVFINPDGGGSANLVQQRQQLLRDGLGVNVALLVPHGAVRGAVLGMADRAPDAEELERMRALVRQGMEAGAFGLSSGPFYAPGSYATTAELVELARVAAAYGGVYTSHIRDESDYTIGVVAAVDEVIEVSRQAGLPGIVTHIKALGPRVWGYSAALVHRIDRAREQGLEIYADQYPYEASSTGLSAALVPRWAQAGGQDSLDQRLASADTRARIRAEMVDNLDRRGGAARIMFGRYAADPSIEGRTLADIAAQRGADPVDVALDLVRGGGPGIISFNMHESDIRRLMAQPWTMTASDGALPRMGEGFPHPRAYGTFPRRIRRYVIEEGVTDLATAIRSMTSLPATAFRMHERGVVRAGAIADLVLFDLDRLRDVSTFADPHHLSEGVVHVLIGGRFAMRDGRPTDTLHGRVLERGR
jgi:N-acyl-D-amino-acid deacylase